MNKIIKITIVISLINLVYSCGNNKEETSSVTAVSKKANLIDTAKWFLGIWQNKSSDGVYTEQWELTNDSVYSGVSTVVVNNKDTVFYESIMLERKGSELFYRVSVKDQNKGLPVSFKLINATDKQLVFENPEHDFPSKITYLKITEDSIVASISGIVEGKEKVEQFPMKKIK